MKGKQQDISSIIQSKTSLFRAIILYGPNTFFIDELYKGLSHSLIDQEKEIFGSREFEAKELTGGAEEFYNEIQSITFGLEKKYVKINMFGSEAGGAILDFFEGEQDDVCLIVKAGALSPRSSLRKAAETSKNAIIVPFYEDDNATLINFIRDRCKKRNFQVSRDSCSEIINLSGLERGRVNDSLERLMLYLESSEKRQINIEDIKQVLFDTNQSQMNELCASVCLGKTKESQQILSRLMLQGVTAPQFVSALLGHFQKIHIAGLKVLSGATLGAAIKEIKPPIFYKEIKGFQGQVENWGVKKTERALEILAETDLKTKTFSGLGKSIIGDVVLRLTNVSSK